MAALWFVVALGFPAKSLLNSATCNWTIDENGGKLGESDTACIYFRRWWVISEIVLTVWCWLRPLTLRSLTLLVHLDLLCLVGSLKLDESESLVGLVVLLEIWNNILAFLFLEHFLLVVLFHCKYSVYKEQKEDYSSKDCQDDGLLHRIGLVLTSESRFARLFADCGVPKQKLSY